MKAEQTFEAGTTVEHVTYPGDLGEVLEPAGPVGGRPAYLVRWGDGDTTATWAHLLRVADDS